MDRLGRLFPYIRAYSRRHLFAPRHCSELLRHMKRQAMLDRIQDILMTTKWMGKISAWPESKSTSPSGFHLTHSKALVAKHDLSPNSPEYAALEEQRKQLIQWQVDLLNVAIKNQYSFHRWESNQS